MRDLVRFLFIGLLAFLIIPACVKEGPPGLNGLDGADGADGADGSDGTVSCIACHSDNTLEAIQSQFAMSVHISGLNAEGYAGGRADCARCHSHEGFVHYAEFGTNLSGNITSPSAWECGTCHGIHKSFEVVDYALRLSDPVNPIFNPEIAIDLNGSSNLCANCHQSRRAEPALTNPGEETFAILNTYWGPHHGSQANLVAGVGMAEIEGSVAYPEPGSAIHLAQASCTGCHMSEFSNGAGGHSWIPNVNSCNDCHQGSDLVDDFDYGGVQTDIQNKLEELKLKLVDRGVIVEENGDFHPVPGTYPTLHARAFFNWNGILEDRSFGVHNPKYIRALLVNTLEALDAE